MCFIAPPHRLPYSQTPTHSTRKDAPNRETGTLNSLANLCEITTICQNILIKPLLKVCIQLKNTTRPNLSLSDSLTIHNVPVVFFIKFLKVAKALFFSFLCMFFLIFLFFCSTCWIVYRCTRVGGIHFINLCGPLLLSFLIPSFRMQGSGTVVSAI